jgi:glycosyltransferase involved in cell wall biosynthesis
MEVSKPSGLIEEIFMKIVIFHPVVLPVQHYGGTERVLMWLVDALKDMGHQVSVFAAQGSRMPPGVELIIDRSELLKRSSEFDVFHAFTKTDQEWIHAFQGRYLVTIHGNGQLGEQFHPNSVFVSRNHAERHGATAFVYNGLDVNDFEVKPLPRPDHFVFLSKTSWRVKNLKGAIRLASRMGQNLWVAGGSGPMWLKIRVLTKRLMGRDWKWVGSVDQRSKAEFLEGGKAMLFPLLWNEPFGIVITESLACGTPVLAHPYGSVPELLEFAPQCLMRTEKDWEMALTGQVSLPTPEECRAWVEKYFTKEKMAENYLKLYEIVKSGKNLNPQIPVTKVLAEDIGGVNP